MGISEQAAVPEMPSHLPQWQAPCEVEQQLYDAKARADWAAYFDVLADADLFHGMRRGFADANPGSILASVYWEPRMGVECYAYFTRGMLPAPVEDPVFYRTSLASIVDYWPRPHAWLAVNPGTPCEAFFPAAPAQRALWAEHTRKASDGSPPVLHTLRVGAPLRGAVAHGLACGALLNVRAEMPWNELASHGSGYPTIRRNLKDWWGITSREGWQQQIASLLQDSESVWEFVLEVRRAIARQYGGAVDLVHWREVTARVMQRNGADEAEIGRVQQVIGRITRYEARFRADGLLGESKHVRSVNAWYYGRASNMARWGVAARYCGIAEAEQAVIRAGQLSQATYHSWQDFSAGFILGRCLHFDEEEFGDWYQDVLDVHRLLVSDPNSPWLTLPWK